MIRQALGVVRRMHARRLVSTMFTLLVCIVLPIMRPALSSAYTAGDYSSIYNGTPWYDPNAGNCSNGATGSTTLTGSDNPQRAFNFFVDQGMAKMQAAAIVGNFMVESSVNPAIAQFGGGPGRGIAQWSVGGRWDTDSNDNMLWYAQTHNEQPLQLGPQLEFSWYEFNNVSAYKQALGDLNAATDITKATAIVMNEYEAAGAVESLSLRASDASEVLAKYGQATANSGTNNTNGCATGSVNCSGTSSTATTNISPLRQKVVCIAQTELATWKSQANYGKPYPQFTYAQTGLLKYTDGVYEAWCADFVSWIYKNAGYPFSGGSSGGWRLPGVVGIYDLGAQDSSFHLHVLIGSGKFYSPSYVPKPGDVAIHYDASQSNPFSHTNIFISASGGVSTYIGGDQGPNGPYGQANPPENGSIVSTETGKGYTSNGIIAYVSPD